MKNNHKKNELKVIPYGKHYVDDDDIQAVVDVLQNGWLTQGPKVREFEDALAKKVGANHAVAVSSGTAALHLACLVSKFDKDSKIITSANSFVASANCVEYVGASVYFTDIDKKTLNMSPDDLEKQIFSLGQIDAIIPVNFAGTACDMKKISSIAKKHNAIVIEDASHALGASYEDGGRVGNCNYSDMTIFSLHPVKGVTAGEGGVITTNDEKIYKELSNLRSHGIHKGNFEFPGISVLNDEIVNTNEAVEDGKLNPWYYEMHELGYNYRITDIQCALALSQLNKLEMFIKKRREISKIYDDLFRSSEIVKLTQTYSRNISANHLYVLRIDYESIGISRAKLMELMLSKGIGSQVHYVPIPMHPYYQKKGFNINDYPETKEYYRQALSIPIFFELDINEIREIAQNIVEILSNFQSLSVKV